MPMGQMKPETLATIGRWAVMLPPVAALLVAGISKFTQSERWREDFETWGLPEALSPVIGVLEVMAALGMYLAVTRFYGGVLAVLIMLGAIGTHVAAGEWAALLAPLAVGVLSGVTAWWARPEWFEELVSRPEEPEVPQEGRSRRR